MSKSRNLIYIFLISLICYCTGEEKTEETYNPTARLLVSKQVLNKYLVQNKDIQIKYSIYNIGKAAAIDVELKDYGFNAEEFEVFAGSLSATFIRIPADTNVTHIVIVQPKRFGYFNFTSALVSYRINDDPNSKTQIVHSSEPGQGGIIDFKEFDKKFSAHYWDWLAFALMTFPSLVIPFALWFNSKRTYEALNNKPVKKQH